MSRKAKYIIWDDGLTYCVATFSTHLNHADFANMLGVNPISAGFVEFRNDNTGVINVFVSGESTSLQLSSRPEDAEIIAREFQLNRFL